MDDVEVELRRLGEAAENATPVVSVDDVLLRSESANEPTEIGTAPDRPAVIRHHRRLSPKVLVAAAAVLVVVATSLTFIGNGNGEEALDISSAIQGQTQFVAPANDNGWEDLRQCESNGNYAADTGNSFYGAYQFTRAAWNETVDSLALQEWHVSNPADAPPVVQDAVANALYRAKGTEPWPICGANLTGPMVTPVVPQWVADAVIPRGVARIFLSPSLSSEGVDQVRDQIRAIVGEEPFSSSRFVDQDEAFAEYQAMFGGDQEMLKLARAVDMPARFDMPRSLTPPIVQELRQLTGVFDVIQNAPLTLADPLRLSIPAIGLETPVYPSASVANLDRGAAVLVNDVGALVIGGYGSVDGSVFHRLDDVRHGDVIIVTALVDQAGDSFEVVRHFVADVGNVNDEPSPVALGDMLLWRSLHGQRLDLVADIADQPEQRMVVRTTRLDPSLDAYPESNQG